MSFAEMIASAERLSKNLERKITKPVVKKESKMNVNDKQIKKVPMMMRAATVPHRSVFEVTKTRLSVPLTPKPARLLHQCIREENLNTSYIMPFNKKDVAVQTMPQNDTIDMQKTNESNRCDHNTIDFTAIKVSSFQQQSVDMGWAEEKTLSNEVPFKYIVKKFDKFLRKNMKATNLLKENRDKLSAQRIVATATHHNRWKHFMYFSSFTIGVITTYVMNYAWHCFLCIENSPLLLK
ncbi:uncharacterized protein LOC113552476 [Rhopalosiphum maidis]|uniref:uncharacterized protein LOC113552476 n=1 Tax=Rhopalosiphum maidis TaxID=43146 RepID=UPI000F00542F|nr:uncharacterized protein LOC113552476 [Rhopalosiphum maidis]